MESVIHRLNAVLDGRYLVDREIGEGGMATVYRADDLRHERKVALKVLRPELAAVVGGDRFLSEIRTTANLQHPHILPLFDSGTADGFLFYVMPFVEGESLRQRLDRETQLGVAEAVDLTTKLARALGHAHARGIVHRDVKPGNVLLSQPDEPVIGDFGIALAVAHAGAGRVTETGLSLGTPHYMSPEQATGDRSVDARSDQYALACVLYEMLAGEPPFTGATTQAVLARLLTADAPRVDTVRRTVPPNVSGALAKALEKLPADRFTSVEDFATALADPAFRYGPEDREVGHAASGETPALRHSRRRGRPALVAAVAAAVLASILAVWGWARPGPPPGPVTRAALEIEGLPPFLPFGDVLVSPDGSRFAVAGLAEVAPIYWRTAAGDRFRPVPGTEGTEYAAFAPDGRSLAFGTSDGRALMRVNLDGGAPETVAPLPTPDLGGLDWGDGGTIVYTGSGGTGLFSVPASGGEPRRLLDDTTLVRNPKLLPGERAVIYTHQTSSTYLLDLESGERRLVRSGAVDALYVETGHLLFTDARGTMWAVPFDPERGETVGDPVTIFGGLARPNRSYARFHASRNGTLVYALGPNLVGGGGQSLGRLVNNDGSSQILNVPFGETRGVEWSPDGGAIVYSSGPSDDDRQIWTYDVELGIEPRQITFEGVNEWPIFSPDGSVVAFASRREGSDDVDVYVKSLVDDTPVRRLLSHPGFQTPTDWPSADLMLLESEAAEGGNSEIWTLDLSDPDAPSMERYLPSPAGVDHWVARLSADGRMVAYEWDGPDGRDNAIYIRSFPRAGAPTRVSPRFGFEPRWGPDGRTLYYIEPPLEDDAWKLIAATIEVDPTPVVVGRRPLPFTMSERVRWAVHPDGDRFMVIEEDVEGREQLVVVTNWFQELLDRAGG